MRMNILEIIDQKKNIFDHLLYEFEMYLRTYSELVALDDSQKDVDFKRNVLIESHAVHLRNLIEFLNYETDCITTKTVFTGNHDLSFDDSLIKAKQTINKAIDHLTKERYTWNQTKRDLTLRINDIIHRMYYFYIVDRIKKCISMLMNNTDINSTVIADLQNERIQARLHDLEEYCNSL